MSSFRPSTVLGCALAAAPAAWLAIRHCGPEKVVRRYKDEHVTNIDDGILLSRVTIAGSGRACGRDVTYTYTWATPRRIHVEPSHRSRDINVVDKPDVILYDHTQYSLFKLTKRTRVLTWTERPSSDVATATRTTTITSLLRA